MKIETFRGDCLDTMKDIGSDSVDLILADPPYGTTQCAWDSIIPLDRLWSQLTRIIKPKGAIVMTATQPFTSLLITSNLGMFKYNWVWEKTTATGHLNAKKRPLRAHEDIVVFCKNTPYYYPQKTSGHPLKTAKREPSRSDVYGKETQSANYASTERYPRTVIKTSTDKQKSQLHPTQKPIALMRYLIETYTLPEQKVLDFAMGSGTTGIACKDTNRDFLGIEKDPKYYDIAVERLSKHEGDEES